MAGITNHIRGRGADAQWREIAHWRAGCLCLFTAILHLSHCSLCRAVLLNARKDAKVSSPPLSSDKHAECVRIQNQVSNSRTLTWFCQFLEVVLDKCTELKVSLHGGERRDTSVRSRVRSVTSFHALEDGSWTEDGQEERRGAEGGGGGSGAESEHVLLLVESDGFVAAPAAARRTRAVIR